VDLSIFGYQFMQNAIIATLLGGATCGTIGVFVVLLHMPFIRGTSGLMARVRPAHRRLYFLPRCLGNYRTAG
jgi:hypothetical protein